MKIGLVILGMFLALNSRADEQCKVGLTCEMAKYNDFIVRETTLVRDESLLTCQTVTLKNYGSDEFSCQKSVGKKHAYNCISQTLQAINSDIWNSLTETEIDDLLSQNPSTSRSATVTSAAENCDR